MKEIYNQDSVGLVISRVNNLNRSKRYSRDINFTMDLSSPSPPPFRKKLMPKSALLVRRYQREIRIGFYGLLAILTTLFLLRGNLSETENSKSTSNVANSLKPGTSPIKNANYFIPSSDKSQGAVHPPDDGIREKGVYVTLARNEDLYSLTRTIQTVEDRHNNRYHYDWVFLNDVPFTDEFIRVTSALASGTTKYGLIPKEHWSVPDWIDKDKLTSALAEMTERKIIYGGSTTYRHMCRFNSGFFWQHPLLDEYDWYWRVDTDITLFCDIPYDIFKFMRVNDVQYGWAITLTEYGDTIPTLWSTVREFMKLHPEYIQEDNLMDFISDDEGSGFNGCHFWSNFEAGSLNFYRSKAFRDFFNYLDQKGGFFYERWGDAPVHSIAAALMLNKKQVHFFDGIGYHHPDFLSCPPEEKIRLQNRCSCDPKKSVLFHPADYYFCTKKYFKVRGLPLPPGI